jgi:hypothetical protein
VAGFLFLAWENRNPFLTKQKMMKKLMIVIAAAAVSVNAKAQLFYAQGGVNFANISTSNSGQTEKNYTLTTFNAGLMSSFGLSKIVDLETGLLVTGRGAKAESYFNNGNDYVKAKFNPLYLELPLNLLIKFPIAGGSHLFVNAGPYAAIGIGGKSKQESKLGPLLSSSETKIKFNDDDPFTSQQEDAGYNKLKRFDYGLNFGGGIAFRHIILKANYGLGLAKINSTDANNNSDDKNKYRTASVSIGIPFGN